MSREMRYSRMKPLERVERAATAHAKSEEQLLRAIHDAHESGESIRSIAPVARMSFEKARRIIKGLSWVAAIAVALTLATGTQAADQTLEAQLSQITGTEVRCADSFGLTGDGGRPSGTHDPASGVISLTTERCRWISESLTAPRKPRYGYYEAGWNTLAHEYAHHLGYDHGETTVGADCVAERKLDRKLMRRAGLNAKLARAIDNTVRRLDCH